VASWVDDVFPGSGFICVRRQEAKALVIRGALVGLTNTYLDDCPAKKRKWDVGGANRDAEIIYRIQ
jgi:hypothetical protein